MASAWTKEHIAAFSAAHLMSHSVPMINNAEPIIDGIMLWDMWPLQNKDGSIALINGDEYWMILSAPDHGDPALRHFEAQIRLVSYRDAIWHDLGAVLPKMNVPYQREWAGTALLDKGRVSLYFTGAGLRNSPNGYQQSLYESHAQLLPDGRFGEWSIPKLSLSNDGQYYAIADQQDGEPGKIIAFRDPAYFCDPSDGQEYLIFSSSLPHSKSAYRGSVGIAKKIDGAWQLLPMLAHADGLNNEMERAHVVFHAGLYYLFWSTQSSTFNPEGPIGPTGLYGMVSDQLLGPYLPLNKTGLVLANPPAEPYQTYSWHVTAELRVSSFVDHWGLKGASLADNPALIYQSFGGTPAPFLNIHLNENKAVLLVDEPKRKIYG